MLTDLEQPEAPSTVEELGLGWGLLGDLVLKTFYSAGNVTAQEIADRLALALPPTVKIIESLRRERLCEALGGDTQSPGRFRYTLTAAGLDRAKLALAQSGYAGPAPVPLREYVECIRRQSIHKAVPSRQQIEGSLARLVLGQQTVDLIGQALTSQRAMILYGASGNGKSTIAECLGRALPGHILIPHAIEVMNQVIQVYDPATHQAVGMEKANGSGERDRRWLAIERPRVFAAGELAASHLELIRDDVNNTYEAPIQMKANGGLLVIDDFGRQRLDAAYLLNRWIVPLERAIDNLSLHNGARFQVPFDVIPVFLTNKRPAELADEAFLRRIRYKIEVPSPTTDHFVEILERECQRNEVAYDEAAIQHLIDEYFKKHRRQMRGCHPRDIVEAISDAASYQGTERALTPSTIRNACAGYFA
jgi:predicted ATPase with chaperone activity